MESTHSHIAPQDLRHDGVAYQKEFSREYKFVQYRHQRSTQAPPSGQHLVTLEPSCDQTSVWSDETSLSDVTMTPPSDHDVAMTSLLCVSGLESPESRDVGFHDNNRHSATTTRSVTLSDNEYSASMTSRSNYGNSVRSDAATSCWLSDADYSASIMNDNNDVIEQTRTQQGQHPRFLDASYKSVQLSDSYYTPPPARPTPPARRPRGPVLGVNALTFRHNMHHQAPRVPRVPPPRGQGIKRKLTAYGESSNDGSSFEDSRIQGLSAISDIQNATDASLRHERLRRGGERGGPLNSSIRYPRNSTPERRRTGPFKHTRYGCKCNRKLVFGSGENIQGRGSMSSQTSSSSSSSGYSHTEDTSSATHQHEDLTTLGSTTLYDSSSFGFNPFEFSAIPYRGTGDYTGVASSNYQYPPHKIRHIDPDYQCTRDPANQSCVTDSDASGFIYVPMAPRPVTHKDKVKVNRRKVISQQLKTIGRRIRKHGARTLNMNTLAVL